MSEKSPENFAGEFAKTQGVPYDQAIDQIDAAITAAGGRLLQAFGLNLDDFSLGADAPSNGGAYRMKKNYDLGNGLKLGLQADSKHSFVMVEIYNPQEKAPIAVLSAGNNMGTFTISLVQGQAVFTDDLHPIGRGIENLSLESPTLEDLDTAVTKFLTGIHGHTLPGSTASLLPATVRASIADALELPAPSLQRLEPDADATTFTEAVIRATGARFSIDPADCSPSQSLLSAPGEAAAWLECGKGEGGYTLRVIHSDTSKLELFLSDKAIGLNRDVAPATFFDNTNGAGDFMELNGDKAQIQAVNLFVSAMQEEPFIGPETKARIASFLKVTCNGAFLEPSDDGRDLPTATPPTS